MALVQLKPRFGLGRARSTTDPSLGAAGRARADPVWPWIIGAIASWIGFSLVPHERPPTIAEAVLLIAGITTSLIAAMVLARTQVETISQRAADAATAAVTSQLKANGMFATPPGGGAPPSVHEAASAPIGGVDLGGTVLPVAAAPTRARPCPCGFCTVQVDDQNGYLTSMTRWVLAVDGLCKQALDAMETSGWVKLPVFEFASDTGALRELLVQTCHEGGGTRAIWTIQGLVTVWEQSFLRVEPDLASTLESGRYLAWHAATTAMRNARSGS